MPTLPPPTLPPMEPYEVLGRLATALYGDVLQLRDRRTNELLALKRVELAFAARRRAKDSNRPLEEDVFAEIQTNMRLRRLGGHRHIVALRDCFTDATTVSLVTEFCAQGELLQVFNRRGAVLPVSTALSYVAQIASGLAFLHAQGIAHRDLSLENVLVDAWGCCKLSDFGMATTHRTVRATGIGKVHYMSPEAAVVGEPDAEMYDPFPADMWSLGVMLCTLLVGRYPFDEPVETDAHFRLVRTLGIEYLLERWDFDTRQHRAVVELVASLLQIDPTARPTAQELLVHPLLASRVQEGEPQQRPSRLQVGAKDKRSRSDAMFVLRRPTPIDTRPTVVVGCEVVAGSRPSPAALKEERTAVRLASTAPTPVVPPPVWTGPMALKRELVERLGRARRPPRASNDVGAGAETSSPSPTTKRCLFRHVLDGVLRRKRSPSPTPRATVAAAMQC